MLSATLRLFSSRQLLSTSSRMASADPHSIYQFTVKDADGKDVNLGDKYKGKVVVVVNVASQCGFTNSNYTQLKEILDQYKSKGVEVAAFPCNQFNSQEPGCEIDIKKFQQENLQHALVA